MESIVASHYFRSLQEELVKPDAQIKLVKGLLLAFLTWQSFPKNPSKIDTSQPKSPPLNEDLDSSHASDQVASAEPGLLGILNITDTFVIFVTLMLGYLLEPSCSKSWGDVKKAAGFALLFTVYLFVVHIMGGYILYTRDENESFMIINFCKSLLRPLLSLLAAALVYFDFYGKCTVLYERFFKR
jgi:hypothetical protein